MQVQGTRTKAAQYVRMSTERQEYSPEFQMATNAAYALERNLEIVRTYTDEAASGLFLKKRDGLKNLIADVVSGQADFKIILVYDVSRWGRFINADQAAHYEFLCAEAGVQIAYCAEAFENDGSPTSTLMKQMKRVMAADYSRELSQKVSRAQRGLLAQGFWTGGRIPIGYRPAFIRRGGKLVTETKDDYWRKQQGVRTKLILGPEAEVELVQRIFRLYLRPNGSFVTVSRALMAGANLPPEVGLWSPRRVADVLRNEVYVGRFVGGRRIRQVGESWGVAAPPDQWIIAEDAAPAIVDHRTFEAARRKRLRRAGPITRDDALQDLHRVAKEHGDVSQRILKLHGRWSVGVYCRLFGSITAIRELLEMPMPEKYTYLLEHMRACNRQKAITGQTYTDEQLREALRTVLRKHGRLSEQLLDAAGTPNTSTIRRRFGSMLAAYRAVGYEPSELQMQAIASAAKRTPGTFR